MKVLLLDDEMNARETIKIYLDRFPHADFEIREASNIKEAYAQLEDFQPDFALLDINLRQGTSFDFLSLVGLDAIAFKIIFITAFNDYAVKAFKFNAIDYILKPVNPIEFNESIRKVISQVEMTDSKLQLQNLHSQITSNAKAFDKIVLRDQQQIRLVPTQDIVYCRSENNYTVFHMVDGSEIVISKTLKEYEDLLKERHFFRTHRSHLINLNLLKIYDKREGGSIQMRDGSTIPLARNKKDLFMRVLDGI